MREQKFESWLCDPLLFFTSHKRLKIPSNSTMKYISADGSIKEKPRSLFQKFSSLKPKWKAVTVAAVAFGANRLLNPNPLANGNIPAASLHPNQHWNRILKDDGFVRSMTQHLGSNRREAELAMMKLNPELYELKIAMGSVDFGGPDGHIIENGDFHDIKYMQGTRCSTTRSGTSKRVLIVFHLACL